MKNYLRYSLVGLLIMTCAFAQATNVVFDFTNLTKLDSSVKPAIKKNSGVYVGDEIFKSEDVQISFKDPQGYDDSNSTKIWTGSKGYDLRVYKKGEITVAAPTGKDIASITFTGDKITTMNTGKVGTFTSPKWKGKASSVTFNVTGTLNINTISVKIVNPEQNDPEISYAKSSLSYKMDGGSNVQTLTNKNNLPVTYASSNENVAIITADGTVSVKGLGTTTIKAEFAGNENYYDDVCSYDLLVTSDNVVADYTESFADNIGSFTIKNEKSTVTVWEYQSYGNMKATGYVSKKNNETISWLISPIIDLSKISNPQLSFEECVNEYFKDEVSKDATVWVKEENGEWKQIEITHPSVTKGYSEFEKKNISLDSYKGKKIQVGFKYESSTTVAGTWEIKNFAVTGSTTAVEHVTTSAVTTDGSIYNLVGQKVGKDYKGVIIKNGKKYIQK